MKEAQKCKCGKHLRKQNKSGLCRICWYIEYHKKKIMLVASR